MGGLYQNTHFHLSVSLSVAIYNDNDASTCFLIPFYTWYFKTMFTPLSIQLRFLCKKISPHVILTSEKYLKDYYEVGFSYIILSL